MSDAANILISFFQGVDVFIQTVFILLPPVMRMLAFSILLTTISKCMKNRKGWKWTLGKISLVLFYIAWGGYKFSILQAMSLGEQIFSSIGLFLCLFALVVLNFGRNLSIMGYKIINYYTIWAFYFVALTVMLFYYYAPGAIGFSIFFLGFCIILIRLSKNQIKDI